MDKLRNEYELLSRSEAAIELRIGKSNLDRLINSGKIGVIPIGSRKKISRGELQRFEKESSIRVNLLKLDYYHQQTLPGDILAQRKRPSSVSLLNNDDLNRLLNMEGLDGISKK